MKTIILSTSSYLPENVITNDDLEQFPKAARAIIKAKTGIERRRHANETETVSFMGTQAALCCLKKSQVAPSEVDAVILCSSSPDRIQPASAAVVQNAIHADKAFAFDINSVCSGGIVGLAVADSFIQSGFCRKILLVASEKYSSFLNKNDISTFPYFGDGAAAVLLAASEDKERGIITTILHTDGSRNNDIQIPAGGSLKPGWQVQNTADFYFQMNGRAVYDFVVKVFPEIIQEIAARASIGISAIDRIIPHQANSKLIQTVAETMFSDPSRVYINVRDIGNTAGASVLMALDSAFNDGSVKKGDLILLAAFGGGLTWGGTLIRV